MSEYMNHYRYYCLTYRTLSDIITERKRIEILMIEHTMEEIEYKDRVKALNELERIMKKELSRLRYHLRRIEHLVGVCKIYGDDYVTEYDIIKIKQQIEEVEREYENTCSM